jgi:hypothetical protein
MGLIAGFGQKTHLNGNFCGDETVGEKATFLIQAYSCIHSEPVQRRPLKTRRFQSPLRATLIKIEQKVGVRFPKRANRPPPSLLYPSKAPFSDSSGFASNTSPANVPP